MSTQFAQRENFSTQELNRLQERVALLESINTRDEVTGLLNRAGIEAELRREIARVERTNETQHLFVAVQIDNLDAIEKHHGILAAQMAAKILARSLSGQARDSDLLGRVARDEFAMLLINADADAAIPRIQTLNLGLNRLSFFWNGETIALHISLAMQNCYSAQSLKGLDI